MKIKYLIFVAALSLLFLGTSAKAGNFQIDGYVIIEDIYTPVANQIIEIRFLSGELVSSAITNNSGFFTKSFIVSDSITSLSIELSRSCNDEIIFYKKEVTLENPFASCIFFVCPNQQCRAMFNAEQISGDSLKFQFTDISTGNINAWYWDFDDGSFSTEQNPIHEFEIPDHHYIVWLTVTGQNCENANHKGVWVNYRDCMSKFSFEQINQGQYLNVYFTDKSEGNVVDWFWDFGEGQISNQQNPVHTYAHPGIYEVTLDITTTGCWPPPPWTNNTVVVTPVPGCYALFESEQIYSDELEVNFTDLSVGKSIKFWLWQFGDSTTSDEPSPTHIYYEPGFYDVSLSVSTTSSNDTYTRTIEVIASADCTPDFVYSQPNPDIPELFFTSLSANESLLYFWNFGDGTTSTDKSPVHLYESFGQYQVSLSVLGTGCQDSLLRQIELVEPIFCGAQFSFEQAFPQSSVVTFINQSFGNNFTCSWDFGDGFKATEANPVHDYDLPGLYNARLIINTADSCSDSTEMVIEIQPPLRLNGKVYAGNSLLNPGYVVLYKIAENGTIDLFEQQTLDAGSFEFSKLLPGIYFIQAFPDFDFPFPLIPDYFPTYSGQVMKWQDAMLFNTNALPENIQLNLSSYNDFFDGKATLSGTVITTERSQEKPLILYLSNSENEVLSFEITSEQNHFEFIDIPYGTYELFPEKVGKTGYALSISLDENDPEMDNIQFIETALTIIPDLSSNGNAIGREIYLSPNPASTFLNIYLLNPQFANQSFTVNIYSPGFSKLISVHCEGDQNVISTSKLADGLYIIELIFDSGTAWKKLLIQH